MCLSRNSSFFTGAIFNFTHHNKYIASLIETLSATIQLIWQVNIWCLEIEKLRFWGIWWCEGCKISGFFRYDGIRIVKWGEIELSVFVKLASWYHRTTEDNCINITQLNLDTTDLLTISSIFVQQNPISWTVFRIGTITEKSSVTFSLGGDNLKRYFDQRKCLF